MRHAIAALTLLSAAAQANDYQPFDYTYGLNPSQPATVQEVYDAQRKERAKANAQFRRNTQRQEQALQDLRINQFLRDNGY